MEKIKLLPWKNIKKELNKIFDTRWFTNHGPALIELEAFLQEYFQVKYAICIANYTIAEFIVNKISMDLKIICFKDIISFVPGACICTDNDDIAIVIKNMRSSYGADPIISVELTGNGRMSEAQARLILLAFKVNK